MDLIFYLIPIDKLSIPVLYYPHEFQTHQEQDTHPMTATQIEFDFNARTETPRKPRRSVRTERKVEGRPHHRTTILTVSQRDFNRVLNGETIPVQFCNDIVSTTNGKNIDHYCIRRIDLLRRQVAGGFRKVKIRYSADLTIDCLMSMDGPEGASDDCYGWITVQDISQAENK